METYYNPVDLKKVGNIGEYQPEFADNFFAHYGAVFAEGALRAGEKSLVGLAVAHALQCLTAYSAATLAKGCSEPELLAAVHVAAASRGGATLVHGVQLLNKVKALSM